MGHKRLGVFMFEVVGIFMILVVIGYKAEYHAKSYAHFKGPVEGPVKPVIIHSHEAHDHFSHSDGGHVTIDYVAQPKYEFAYGVLDHKHGDSKTHKEVHDGHRVVGEYSLQEPGGNIRTVKYVSDKNGFQAEVHNSGGNIHTGHQVEYHDAQDLGQAQIYAGVQQVAILPEQSQY